MSKGMARLLPTSVLVGLLLLLTALLVRSEGESYRRSLRARRDADLRARLVPKEPSEVPALARADSPPPEPADRAPKEPEPEPPSKAPEPKGHPPEAAPEKEPAPPEPAAPKVAETTPKRPTPPEADAEPPAPKPPDPFAGLAKQPTTMTLEEERQVGRALNSLIVRRHRVLESGELQRRMIEAARPLLAGCQRKDLDYHFTVLDYETPNAFSHPGGYVYVSEGLFNLIADDAELQFVLGHEIAHVDQKHAAERVAASAGDPDGPGLVPRFYRQIAVGYTDDQEFAADAWAFRQLLRLGYSRRKASAFPLRYRTFVERNGLSGGHHPPKSAPEADVQDVENHWRTLPSAAERLDRLQALPGGA
jgi:hypothetical protein